MKNWPILIFKQIQTLLEIITFWTRQMCVFFSFKFSRDERAKRKETWRGWWVVGRYSQESATVNWVAARCLSLFTQK